MGSWLEQRRRGYKALSGKIRDDAEITLPLSSLKPLHILLLHHLLIYSEYWFACQVPMLEWILLWQNMCFIHLLISFTSACPSQSNEWVSNWKNEKRCLPDCSCREKDVLLYVKHIKDFCSHHSPSRPGFGVYVQLGDWTPPLYEIWMLSAWKEGSFVWFWIANSWYSEGQLEYFHPLPSISLYSLSVS